MRRSFPTAAALVALFASLLVPAFLAPAQASATHPTPQAKHWTPNLKIPAGKKTARWRSGWVSTRPSTTLLPSWNVTQMPTGTWLRVYARVASGSKVSGWKRVADWRYALAGGERRTWGAQSDSLARLDTDTIRSASGRTFDRWQVQVTVVRPKTSTKTPVVSRVAGVASSYSTKAARTSKTSMTRTVDLAVPAYSQMIHTGHFPQYGGGGEAWCSPTSTSMILAYWGLGPKASQYTWAKGPDGRVDHAARFSYDSAYRGTGTWPFNTAYASLFGAEARVHRVVNLRAMEAYIKKGVPVVASVAFGRGQLTGSPINSTPGHLMVVRGFTKTGDVIVNDPAGRTNAQVRRVYQRAQFEKAWLGGSGGVVYLIAPRGKGLVF